MKIRLDSLEDRVTPANGTVLFTATSSAFLESAAAQVVVQLVTNDANLNNPVSVDVSDAGTGTATSGGTDYNTFATTTVTFNPGDSFTVDGANRIYTKPVAVSLVDDRLVEAVENIRFSLGNLVTGGTDSIGFGGITSHRLDISENDSANVSIPTGSTSVTEGGSAQTVTATLTLTTVGTGTEQLAVPISANLPMTNADYTPTAVTFAAGSATNATADISVSAFNDRLVEVTPESFADQALAITSSGGAIASASGSRTIDVTDDDSATISIGTGSTIVTEGGSSQNVTATLTLTSTGSGPEELAVPVSANLPGNADYSSIGATFASGSVTGATANLVVSAVNDAIVEGTENFAGQSLVITSTGGANVTASGTRDITVLDNDTAAITFETSSSSSAEGTTALIGVTLTINADGTGTPTLASQVTVDLAAPAGSGSDITLPSSPAVTFAAGSGGGTQNASVVIVDDRFVEASESFALTFTNLVDPSGQITAGGTHTLTALDNETATVSVTSGTTTAGEGAVPSSVVATLSISSVGTGSEELAVAISANLPGNPDYTATAATFASGSISGATQNILVSGVDDRLVESATELFPGEALAITNSNGASVTATGSRDIAVTDNDSATITVASGLTTATEGATGQNVLTTLTLTTLGSGTEELAVAVSANLPTGNADYSPLEATFAAGSVNNATANVVVTAVNDQLVEVITESFAGQALSITNSNGANVTAAGTHDIAVTDNDKATVAIATGTTPVGEGSGAQNVVATLTLNTSGTGPAQLAVSVDVNLTPGGTDFTTATGSFAAGSTDGQTANVAVTAVDDQRVEQSPELIGGQTLVVTNANGADVTVGGSSGTQTIAVTDNDSATVSIAGGTTTVAEGGPTQDVVATLTLNTTGTGTVGLDVDISANLPGNADYSSTAATFTAGSASGATANIVVTATDDQHVEGTETFSGQALQITSTGGAIANATGSETIIVTDNDTATVAISTGITTATEGGPVQNVVVTLTLNTSGSGGATLDVPVVVDLTPGDGNVDFTHATGTFSPGSGNGATANIAITAVDDRRVEQATETGVGGPQTLIVVDDGGSGATVGSGSGTRTINISDNDSATVTVAAGTTTAAEGGSSQNVPVTLTLNTPGSGTQVLDVDISANLPGNADYSALDATFSAGASDGNTANVQVTAVNDRLVEAITETFAGQALAITSGGGANATASGSRDIAVTDNESATISITPATTAVTEGGSTQNVVATLSITSDGIGSEELAVAISANLPTTNADYTPTAATFASGSVAGATANVVVAAVNDRLVEAITESFTGEALSITSSGGANVTAAGTQDIAVTDNDSATVSVATGTTTMAEAGPAQSVVATLTLNTTGTGPEQLATPITVNLPGNSDYTATAATFASGLTTGATANVIVTAVDDRAVEPFTETFTNQALAVTSTLADVTATGNRTIAITENDSARVTYSGTASLTEGTAGFGLVQATLSLITTGSGTVQLDTPVSATITSGTNDFAAATVTWAAGEAPGAKDIPVTVIDDRIVEQTVESNIANLVPSSAAIVESTGSATVVVTENDSASVAITSPGTTGVTEGDSSANVGVSLTLNTSGTGAIQLGVPVTATLPGNADYSAVAATFAAGSASGATANVSVSATDDAIVEDQETFTGQALSVTSTATVSASGSQSIQVSDNDIAIFTIGDVTVNESAGTATFTLSLDKAIDTDVTIDVNYGGGTATGGGEDYDSTTDSVVFTAGSTTSQQITVAITNDNVHEPTETFVASLSTSTSLGGRTLNLTDTATATIIDNDNGTPTVQDRSLTLAEDTSISATLTGSDPENDPLTFSIVTGPAHGTINLDPQSGSFTYIPAANYNGSDSFTYKANDGNQDSNTATVSLTITAVNDAPVANSGSGTTDEDTALSGTVTATDVDAGAVLTFSVVSGPTHGTLNSFDTSTGAFVYTPNGNFNGSDSFTFKANDGTVDSNTATFSITINPVNDAPVAFDTTASTNEDTTLTGAVSATDVDGNPLTYSVVAQPAHGTVTVALNGTFVYTPNANYSGLDTFSFKANDGTVDSNIGSVIVTVNAVNDAPVANNGTLTTDEDTSANGTVTASDVDSPTLTFSVISGPTHGTLSTFNATTGEFTYTPAANYNGPDSFTFVANDGTVDSNAATVSITVNAVNDAPVASDASFSTNEDTTLTGAVSATDVDNAVLTYSLVSQATHGTVTVSSNGTFVYTPDANYNGADSFTFRASDGSLNSNTATIAITINSVNDAPVANNGSLSTNEDTDGTGTLTATDADTGSILTFSIVAGPAHGTLTAFDGSTGAFTYTPAADYNGPDSFTFVANDGIVDSNVATISITVNAVNDAPVAANGSGTTNEDTVLIGSLSATDVDNAVLTYSLVSGPAAGAGTVTVNGNGTFVYTPAANFNGSASFTFKANDGSLDSNTATVTLTINAVNDAPVANSGSASTNEDVAVSGNLVATDVDTGAVLTYSVVAGPSHGTLTSFNPATGAFTYTPAANYNGADSFTFKANDGTVDSNTATISLNIAAVNDNPTANNDGFVVSEDSGVSTLAVLANDSSAPDSGETLTITATGAASHGTVAIGPGGTSVLYTPAPNYNGPDSFTYTISDGNGGTATATVNVTVSGTNDLPSAVNDSATLVEDGGAQAINVLANDSSAPDTGETLTIISVTQGQHGTVTIVPGNLSLTYTPNADFAGSDTFLYTISDGNGGTAIAAVVVDVTNDAADRLEVITTPGVTTFTEVTSGSAVPVVVDAGIRVGSALEGIIKKATVRIGSGYVKGKDKLTFTNTATIKGTFNATNGTLTLTGNASPADYQAALRTVKFVNASPMPVDGLRVVSFKVQDAAGVGTEAAKIVRVVGVNTKPTLTGTTTALTYRRGAAAVSVAPTLVIKDVDNTRLQSARVVIGGAFAANLDKLTWVNKTGITANFNAATGILTLTGNATLATYQALLRSVKFSTTGAAPAGARTISITVNDGDLNSDALNRTVNVI